MYFLLLIWLLATLLQMGLWAWFGRAFRRLAPQPPPADVKHGVSLIICARNAAMDLQENLPFVLAQRSPAPWELLLVDDASTDETPQVLQGFQEKYPHLRVIRIAEKTQAGKKHALATGIRAARFPLLLLTDADCKPASSQWLQVMVAPLQNDPNTEIVAGYAPFHPAPGLLGLWSRFEVAWTALLYTAFWGGRRPYMAVGRNMALRQSLFERSGGFSAHAHLPSGDDDLLVNATATPENMRTCVASESFVFSAAKSSWGGWFGQKTRHLGASGAYKFSDRILLTAVGMSHCVHYGLIPITLALGAPWVYLLVGYLLRWIMVWPGYRQYFTTFREGRLLPFLPLLDGMLALYYGAFVPLVLLLPGKKRW
jgi:poly-beta-1,6-N-acetyl-D-glucosamine synthase